MARIFNIYFFHKGISESAMLSVQQKPFYKEFTISLSNSGLASQLPGNKIIRREDEDELMFLHSPDEETLLMRSIIKALADQLESIHA